MKRLKTTLFALIAFCILMTISVTSRAQAPNISYSPSSATLTLNIAMTAMTPVNSGGAVPALAYGTGVQLTGATLNSPYGMGVDASGNLYVTNFGNSTISEFNSSGTYVGTFGTSQLSNPSAIGFDKSGNAYVLNYNRTNNGLGNYHGNAYISQYNSTGTYGSIIVQGMGTATGMVLDQSNNIYAAEGSYNNGNNTVAQYDNISGGLAFSLTGTTNPVGVSVDGSGNIYVLDSLGATSAVKKYNSSGTLLSTLISGLSSSSHAIYTDGSGNVYVGDSGNGTVTVYNSAGTQLIQLTGFTDPEGIVTDSKGNLYVSDRTNNTVTEYPIASGYYIDKTLPAGLSFSSTTGAISGTPTTSFSATVYTITAYNPSGSSSTTVTLSCPSSAPTITYDPYSISVFTKSATITSLTPIVTGGPTSYSISSALPAGLSFSTSTGVISGTPTATSAAKVYTVTCSNASGSSSTTISIAVVVDNYWTGNSHINSDWNTKQNWSANKVPTVGDLASVGVINYTGVDPTVSSNTNAYYVTFGPNGPSLTVNSGSTFTVNNILTINNNAAPVFKGSGSVSVASTAVVNVIQTGTLTINSGLTFTLLSDANGSASVSEFTSTGSISGTVSVQRYLTAHRGYRLLASPVNANSNSNDSNGNLPFSLNYVKNSAYITGTTGTSGGFDQAGNPSLYLYREDVTVDNSSFITGNYRGISDITAAPAYSLNNEASTYTIPVSNGFLFFFRGNRASGTVTQETQTTWAATTATLTATGSLNQGQIIFRDWYNPASTSLGFSNSNVAAQGFNLAGNPYASTIDIDSYNTTTTTTGIYTSNLSKYVYELNPLTKNYDTYQAGSSTAGTAIYTNNGSRYIASGQGFFVLATGAGAQLIFNESAKTSTQVPSASLMMTTKARSLAANAPTNNLQMLRLEMAQDTINKDDILVMFDSNAKPGYVFNEDALYKVGSGKVNLSSLSDDNQFLSVNVLPLKNGLTVPLKVGSNAYSTYTLNLKDIKGVPQLFDIWLKDAFTGDSVNMRTTPTYIFSITTDAGSYGAKRFSIVMRENPAYSYQLTNFNADKSGKQSVQITWSAKYEENYTHFTVERSTDHGQTYQVIGGLTSTGAGTYSLVDTKPANGDNLYFLKSEDYNGALSDSKVVKVMFENNGKTVSTRLNLYPNPAVSTVNLTINPKSAESTTFNVKISNSTGLVLKNVTVSGTNWQDNIGNLLSGTYIVEVTDKKDNSLIGQTKFVKM